MSSAAPAGKQVLPPPGARAVLYFNEKPGEEVKHMKRVIRKKAAKPAPERLTEAYEVRAFRDEMDDVLPAAAAAPEVAHAEPGAFQKVKAAVQGHGEQTVLPDDCQFGDNDLCYVEA